MTVGFLLFHSCFWSPVPDVPATGRFLLAGEVLSEGKFAGGSRDLVAEDELFIEETDRDRLDEEDCVEEGEDESDATNDGEGDVSRIFVVEVGKVFPCKPCCGGCMGPAGGGMAFESPSSSSTTNRCVSFSLRGCFFLIDALEKAYTSSSSSMTDVDVLATAGYGVVTASE